MPSGGSIDVTWGRSYEHAPTRFEARSATISSLEISQPNSNGTFMLSECQTATSSSGDTSNVYANGNRNWESPWADIDGYPALGACSEQGKVHALKAAACTSMYQMDGSLDLQLSGTPYVLGRGIALIGCVYAASVRVQCEFASGSTYEPGIRNYYNQNRAATR